MVVNVRASRDLALPSSVGAPSAIIPPMKRTRRSTSGRRAQGSRIGLLTVGQTARILGVSPSTLRLWENVGLISPARSSGRYRLYNPELLQVLKRIKYLRDVEKLSVPGIKEMLGEKRAAATASNSNHRPDFGARTAENAEEPGSWNRGSGRPCQDLAGRSQRH